LRLMKCMRRVGGCILDQTQDWDWVAKVLVLAVREVDWHRGLGTI
jgi:hypothetical protein